jgi:hypothetical protein
MVLRLTKMRASCTHLPAHPTAEFEGRTPSFWPCVSHMLGTMRHRLRVLSATGVLFFGGSLLSASHAHARDDISARSETDVSLASAATTPTNPPPSAEEPPVITQAPRRKGFVVESSVGVLGFASQFRNVAPPGIHLSTLAGYELFRWLMLFGYGELAMTSTSVANGPTKERAFPIYGFGAGARVTVHATPRVGFFAQGGVGLLKSDVPENALQILGYMNAERLRASFGARLGVEWYQVNRHLALGANGGARIATGFAKDTRRDTPIAVEGGLSIRYTF